ncbi:hypothetical protein [uncultured Dokdonia sp.]|uniref:hypothetical protein n=1 Tax=uncultured Dokdonia sp. TaxID=575653 RepID=UPI0026380161|nr:hypothetical protein [uncultured Dokdonia sp.]
MKNLISLGRYLTNKEKKLINGGDSLRNENFDIENRSTRSGAPGAGTNIRIRGIGSPCC